MITVICLLYAYGEEMAKNLCRIFILKIEIFWPEVSIKSFNDWKPWENRREWLEGLIVLAGVCR
jgi:hypothetical protein